MKHKFSYEVIRSFVKIVNESVEYDLVISTIPQPRKKLHTDIEIISPGQEKTYEKGTAMDDLTNLSFRWMKIKK